MQKPLRNVSVAVVLATLFAGCQPGTFPQLFQSATESVEALFSPASPRDGYEKTLRRQHLDQTEAGRAWMAAGDRALTDSLTVDVPFRQAGYFPAEASLAYAYRVTVPAGRQLVTHVQSPQADSTLRLFVDLFEIKPGTSPKRIKFVEAGESLTYEATQETTLMIRLQPELGQSGSFTLVLENAPLLSFPVAVPGTESKYGRIISGWGADRDGGKRRHEGVDIAAPRGTPVLAAADGQVTQVTTNRLGGLVVYQSDLEHNLTLYYAHLHQQLARPGQRVHRGDTLGLVGNTGNAITTGPHLHFGVYPFYQGAANPLPFVDPRGTQPAAVTANTRRLGSTMRTVPAWLALRKAPELSEKAVLSLPKNTVVRPLAATRNWYQVALPDGTAGYVPAAQVLPVGFPVKKRVLTAAAPLLKTLTARPDTLAVLDASERVSVLGEFGKYQLVETPAQKGRSLTGWVPVN